MGQRDVRRRSPQAPSVTIGAVGVACTILDFLAEADAPVGVQQVSHALDLTKSRTSRHLTNLEVLGLVSRAPNSRKYVLGWRVMRWGSIAAEKMNLERALSAPLQKLNDITGETVLLSVSAHGEAMASHCLPSNSDIHIEVKTGLILSLPHSPTARVCFAFQTRERRQQLLTMLKEREQDFRVDNEEEFNEMVAAIQSRYFCWNRNKFNLGYGAIAAPVFNGSEALVGAISLIMPSEEFGDCPPDELVNPLLNCAEECSRLLNSKMQFPMRSGV